MNVATAEKLREIRNKIDALRAQENQLLDANRIEEERERERKWHKENDAAIKFCQGLPGKIYTIGSTAIQHVSYQLADGTTREYDRVDVYFIKNIYYVDTTKVLVHCRRMYADDDSGYIKDECEFMHSVLELAGKSNLIDGGIIHMLDEKELDEAFEYWHRRMAEIYSSRFLLPVKDQWRCRHDVEAEALHGQH